MAKLNTSNLNRLDKNEPQGKETLKSAMSKEKLPMVSLTADKKSKMAIQDIFEAKSHITGKNYEESSMMDQDDSYGNYRP